MLWKSVVLWLFSGCDGGTDRYQIADRLCASIGQDILDCLFSRSTILYLSHRKPVSPQTARPFFFFTLSVIYVGKCTIVAFPFCFEYTLSRTHPGDGLPDHFSKRRSQLVRSRTPDVAHVEPVCRNQRKRIQKVRKG